MKKILLSSLFMLGGILSACNAESEKLSKTYHLEEADINVSEEQSKDTNTNQELTDMITITSQEEYRLENKYADMEKK
ncbi:hypothetical protein [Staphylococcus aureus]|uniref:hypothetical protein n=1 Tax=Staphylococcus aureus TaxID=1280 RepID=UPI001189255C|nr:hypothetical protein [Staphylococcus aureus]QDS48310.1 hypothetical protein FP477_14290 [Staphylococcus aureus]